jgi:hypothetical protein
MCTVDVIEFTLVYFWRESRQFLVRQKYRSLGSSFPWYTVFQVKVSSKLFQYSCFGLSIIKRLAKLFRNTLYNIFIKKEKGKVVSECTILQDKWTDDSNLRSSFNKEASVTFYASLPVSRCSQFRKAARNLASVFGSIFRYKTKQIEFPFKNHRYARNDVMRIGI